MADFSHIENWVFDLDNTLYSPECRLFDQIDEKMTAFIANHLTLDPVQARKIQKDYFFRYGTTLSGLMIEHDVKPDEFLPFVHDIDRSAIPVDTALDDAIGALPGKNTFAPMERANMHGQLWQKSALKIILKIYLISSHLAMSQNRPLLPMTSC